MSLTDESGASQNQMLVKHKDFDHQAFMNGDDL